VAAVAVQVAALLLQTAVKAAMVSLSSDTNSNKY
jgi:hypothetical protein